MEERLISSAADYDDASLEYSLRPKQLREYIGQQKVKENLTVFIEAAKMRGETLDHVLLYGPPGLEKRRWPPLLPTRWAFNCARQLDQRLSGPGTWRQF
ncbi:Holliday junction ATP-dependent DNA helicase RuvB [Anoxybacillus sp. BCO1]|nr:Holliday junction ATP-dependent DNA helicase RuvB [Anoxybacillus sp. BCO1]